MYFITLEFDVIRAVLSLPRWHGARWSAWFREACHLCYTQFDEMVLGLLPMRNGKKPLVVGERLHVRLVLSDRGVSSLGVFLEALGRTVGKGEFSAHALSLRYVHDLLGGECLWKGPGQLCGCPRAFDELLLRDEMEKLDAADAWTIHFAGPLRLPLPEGHPDRGENIRKFAAPDNLLEREGVANLLNRVRFLHDHGAVALPASVQVDRERSSLQWEDMRYNPQRRIALGGVTGSLCCRGKTNLATARRLVLGQYLGAGKNARFGLGFWELRHD